MRLRPRSLAFILILALALGATLASADPQWAVTASPDSVFLMNNQGFVSSPLAPFSGLTLAGIATWGNYVFVAGSASAGDTGNLRVGKIGNSLTGPTIDWIGDPIPLTNAGKLLKGPGAVAVDASGGVYVLGSRWQDGSGVWHSNYAYVTSSSGTWTDVSIVDLSNTSKALADIATIATADPLDYQAVIAHQDAAIAFPSFQTWATGVNGSNPAGAASRLNDTGYIPQGIATGTNGFSYIANHSTEVAAPAGPVDVGSISVIDSKSLAPIGSAFGLGDFRPTDIAFMALGGTNYLWLVGVTNGVSQALQLTLGVDGRPIMGAEPWASLDSSANHYCAASLDGTLLWATNPGASTVTAFNTVTRERYNVVLPIGARAGYIASASYVVPEPSSLLSLLVGGIGILGLRGRRRRS